MTDSERALKKDLVASYRLADHFGWSDLIYGHFSARVPGEPTHFFINPFDVGFNEIEEQDILKVDFEGNSVEPTSHTINKAGIRVHGAVLKARPDLTCVMHTHSPHGMAISALKEGVLPLTQHACQFYNRIAYHDYSGIALDEEEGPAFVESLGSHNVMVLRNHGLLVCGRSVSSAFILLYTLEKAIEAQLLARGGQGTLSLIPDEVAEKTAQQFEAIDLEDGDIEWPMLLRLADACMKNPL